MTYHRRPASSTEKPVCPRPQRPAPPVLPAKTFSLDQRNPEKFFPSSLNIQILSDLFLHKVFFWQPGGNLFSPHLSLAPVLFCSQLHEISGQRRIGGSHTPGQNPHASRGETPRSSDLSPAPHTQPQTGQHPNKTRFEQQKRSSSPGRYPTDHAVFFSFKRLTNPF
ncbi:hypothetical protein [Thermobifida fusca]|uniref:hypothetical protein n=1 Tax=Thermobifida fusca TaxID=2021 RepID=UPI0011B0D0E8|nr:hypothetical protein [Thermobifida fusca]QOS57797.1 hypothetical protein IM867_10115 [Thermobifida fusca]